jgi:hypothetical protein
MLIWACRKPDRPAASASKSAFFFNKLIILFVVKIVNIVVFQFICEFLSTMLTNGKLHVTKTILVCKEDVKLKQKRPHLSAAFFEIF